MNLERRELMQQLVAEGRTKPRSLLTIMFDDESKYVRFVREVYNRFDGDGLGRVFREEGF